MIVKVQRPLFQSKPAADGQLPYLCYCEWRRHTVQQPVPQHAADILARRESGKAYFDCRWDADAQLWIIGKQVKDQNW